MAEPVRKKSRRVPNGELETRLDCSFLRYISNGQTAKTICKCPALIETGKLCKAPPPCKGCTEYVQKQ